MPELDTMLCPPLGGPESLLVAVLLFLVSVVPGQSFLRTQELTAEPTASATPGLHLRFDPRTKTLSWDCQANATRVTCLMNQKDTGDTKVKVRPEDCRCSFPSRDLHGGARLRVRMALPQGALEEELLFTNPGAAGTAAQNLSCAIHQGAHLNCTWAPGPAAPSDVQYFLYIGDSEGPWVTECPHYLQDSGTHRGCHLGNLTGLAYNSLFLVNGTSQQAQIQFLDRIWSTREMERISPPASVSAHCNASHCLLQWTQPRTKTRLGPLDFRYQLSLRRQDEHRAGGDGDASVIEVSGEAGNQHALPSPEPRAAHSLRIRAADARGGPWGPWSHPVQFGAQGQRGGLLHVYLLVVLGTLVCALALGLLFNRFRGLQRLFPPIPQVKDKVSHTGPADHQMDWAEVALGAGKEDLEDIVTVQEVS